jgi:hypothetical protein
MVEYYELAEQPRHVDFERLRALYGLRYSGVDESKTAIELKDVLLDTYSNWINPFRNGRMSVVATLTDERRPPLMGEWYLSGSISQAWRAPNDLRCPYQILRLAIVTTTIIEHKTTTKEY